MYVTPMPFTFPKLFSQFPLPDKPIQLLEMTLGQREVSFAGNAPSKQLDVKKEKEKPFPDFLKVLLLLTC